MFLCLIRVLINPANDRLLWGLTVFAKPIISARCSFWLVPSKEGFPQYSANTDICNSSGFWFLVERPNCFEWGVPTVFARPISFVPVSPVCAHGARVSCICHHEPSELDGYCIHNMHCIIMKRELRLTFVLMHQHKRQFNIDQS